ncbi:MAG: CheY-like chemotaxis protein [Desulforhopalus sp.]|jgi:CheY-like chemotaxis protein
MNESHEDFKERGRDILEYLSSLRLLSNDLDVEVNTARYSGVLQVRSGEVVAAIQGNISGNGALFTLLTQKVGEFKSVTSTEAVISNVTVSHEQMVLVCSKIPYKVGQGVVGDEAALLDGVIHLILQFRKKEAVTQLVELLRSNRFYYPAWLWHSRLMNQVGYLGKAINEMRKWGGHDPLVKAELAKIEPHINQGQQTVKRCIFCWAIVATGQEQCETCKCLLSISTKKEIPGGNKELEASLKRYEDELNNHPGNSRIAYCLCLGKFSLGQKEQAQDYLNKALIISPNEQLFLKTSKFLNTVDKVKDEPQKEKTIKKVEEPPVPSLQPAVVPEKNKTILVIEDSKTSRKVISLVLNRQGYDIAEATTGSEGLAQLAQVLPDLILLDVMLPDMDGYQILSKIRSDDRIKTVPVVMLTGKRSSVDRMKGLASGANEYLTKPFDPAKLVKVLERFMGSNDKKRVSVPVTQAPVVKISRAVKRTAKTSVVPEVKMPPKPVSTSGLSILIVEDSPTTCKVISMVLKRKGYSLQEATTGAEALRLIDTGAPDLILLDAMLPDMSGYDILAQLKANETFQKIPVVMLTAKLGATDRQKGLQAGAVAYLTKPFNPDKLLSTVAQYTAERS